MSDLISEIFDDHFLGYVLGMGANAKLDKSKLVAAGHSMGGATALKLAEQDKNVSLVLTLDPWLYPIHQHLPSLGVPCHLQNSFCFHSHIGGWYFKDHEKTFNSLCNQLKNYESVVVYKQTHAH